MSLKYNKYIFAILLAFGVFTILQYLKTNILYLLTYGTTAVFIWLFSISDIKTKNSIGIMDIYCDGYCVFTSILYDVQLGSEQSSCIYD